MNYTFSKSEISEEKTVLWEEGSFSGSVLSVMLKRPCKFYNTTGKCAFGEHCKFSHNRSISSESRSHSSDNHESVNSTRSSTTPCSTFTYSSPVPENSKHEGLIVTREFPDKEATNSDLHSSTPKENAEAQQPKLKAKQVCRFFVKHKYCHFGRRCRYSHDLSLEAKPADNFGRKDEESLKKGNNNAASDAAISENAREDKVQDETIAKDDSGPLTTSREVTSAVVKQKICKYFQQGHCRYGQKCHFYHPITQNPEEAKAPSVSENTPECSNTEAAKDDGFRQVVRRQKVIHVYDRKDMSIEQQTELRQTEIQQLKRRFPADKIRCLEESDLKAAYVFTFLPTDPDWVGEMCFKFVSGSNSKMML